MPLTLDNIFEADVSSFGTERLLDMKKRMTEKIIDMYFESDFGEELHGKVIEWLFDGDNADVKEAAMQKRFDMIFGEAGVDILLPAGTGTI